MNIDELNGEKLYRVVPEKRLDFIKDKMSEVLDVYNYDPNKHEISSFVVMVGVIDSNENEQTVALADGMLNSDHVVDYLKWLGVLQVVSGIGWPGPCSSDR